MERKYKIKVPKGGAEPIETPDDWFNTHFTQLSIAKRQSGKTCSMSNFLHIMKGMGKLDRVIIVSPTYYQNAHYFKGLPIDEESDILEPDIDSAELIMDKLDEEALEYNEYHEKINKWNKLNKLIKSSTRIEDIDPFLLLDFTDEYGNLNMEKPYHKYNGRKPVVVAFFDDCQNTLAFSPKSKVSYLTIKHRHIGLTIHGALGVSLMFACQNYTSNSGGIPKTIRGNTTILCVFKNKNMKELDLIAEECCGEVDKNKFYELFEEATKEEYSFLTIDFNRKKQHHPSMFRQCWNKFLM